MTVVEGNSISWIGIVRISWPTQANFLFKPCLIECSVKPNFLFSGRYLSFLLNQLNHYWRFWTSIGIFAGISKIEMKIVEKCCFLCWAASYMSWRFLNDLNFRTARAFQFSKSTLVDLWAQISPCVSINLKMSEKRTLFVHKFVNRGQWLWT